MAKQTLYTLDIADEICERISNGETLEDICRDEGMPASRTVREWKLDPAKADFAADLEIARDIGEAVIANNLRMVARGEPGYSTSDVQRDKLIIETDLKLLAKWNPKKWGDKVDHTVTMKPYEQVLASLKGENG